jgi:polysaccharide deacetylase 2 family uncharacterized protein YibQ
LAVDDLIAPLGQNAKERRTIPISVPHVIAGALGLFVVAFALWALVVTDPLGGEPMVLVRADLRNAAPPAKRSEPVAEPAAGAQGPGRYDGPARDAPAPPPAGQAGTKTVTIIDGKSGARQEVVLPATGDAKAAAKAVPLDPRIAESTLHGLIPKIAANGMRPAEAFARPVTPLPGKPDAPRVAIVVSGLGISAAGTTEALAKLPGPVTLAFKPYGTDLDRVVARARGEGHEVLLQVPMEPFDYPDNDPGPQTLLTSLMPDQNVDRLHWLMSRFQGYVGITNYMGARFTASEQAFAPVLREAGKRGLIFIDDGSAPRSLAGQIAGANNVPYAKADVVLDAVPTPAEIDRALGRLELAARERGVAVGFASAMPASIDRIAKWAKAAERRGILLVPITNAAVKPKQS